MSQVISPVEVGAMNIIKYSIEKLTERNYVIWLTKMQLVLESRDLWRFVLLEDQKDLSSMMIILM